MTYGDARPGEGREGEREGGLEEVNPGLSQNPLNHSFMSPSLLNETQSRFPMRKHLCAAGRERYAGISKKKKQRRERKKSSFKCAGEKVVLMVAAWACCHQALRNRADRFLCRKKQKKHVPLVMHAAASFSELPLLIQH